MTPAEIAVILRRLDELSEKCDRIEQHVETTNGRVHRLELWKARMDGARAAMAWLPTLATGVISGGLVALVAYLLSH